MRYRPFIIITTLLSLLAASCTKTPSPDTYPWKVVVTKDHVAKSAPDWTWGVPDDESLSAGDTVVALRPAQKKGYLELLCKLRHYREQDDGRDHLYYKYDTLYSKAKNFRFVESLSGTPYGEAVTRGYIPEEMFPMKIVVRRDTKCKGTWRIKGGLGQSKVSKGDTLVAFGYAPAIKQVEVFHYTHDYDPLSFIPLRDIEFCYSIAGTPRGDEVMAEYAERNSFRGYMTRHSWPKILAIFIIIMIYLQLDKGRLGWFEFLVSLIVALPLGALPPLLMLDMAEGDATFWGVAIWISIFLLGIGATLWAASTSNDYIFSLCKQVRNFVLPAIVSSIVLLFSVWMSEWQIENFWGGLLVWLITVVGLSLAAAAVKTAFNAILDGQFLLTMVYVYLGLITGIYILNAGIEACPVAGWLALIGLIPGGMVKHDATEEWINGEAAYHTSRNNVFKTSNGTRYRKSQDGWGDSFERLP